MILLQFNFNCATQWHYGLLNSTSRGDVCDSRKLWILQTRGPHSDTYIYILVSVYECYATRVNVLIHLPPAVCPQDSLAAYAHTQKKKTNDFSPLMTATVRGEEEAKCLPSLCPSSPTGQRAAPWTWARNKVVQSLWMRLAVPGQSCRAACLFRNGWSCHVGFRDTSTDNNNGMQDSHTDPLAVVVFLFSFLFRE